MRRLLWLLLILPFLAPAARGQLEIPHFASDPPICDPTRGELYYNTTTQQVKSCTALNTWTYTGTSPEVGRIVTGTTDVIGASTSQDCLLQQVVYTNTGGSGVTVTLPSATSLGNPTCGIILVNQTNPAATVKVCANTGAAPCGSTPAGWNINTDSGSSNELDLSQKGKVTFTVDAAGGAWRGVTGGVAVAGVSSVGLTVNGGSGSGIFGVTNSPVNGSGSVNLTVNGATGGGSIPCFTGTNTLASSGVIVAGDAIVGGGPGGCVSDANAPPAFSFNNAFTVYVCPSAQTTCEYNGDAGTAATPSDSNSGLTPGQPFATDAGVHAKFPATIAFAAPIHIQHADTTGPNVAVANTCYQPNAIEFTNSSTGSTDREIFANGLAGGGDNYPAGYIDIAGNLQPTLMGVGTNGLETQTGTASIVQNTGTVTWVSGFMGSGVIPANQFQMGHILNGTKIVINGTTHTISADIPFGGATMTVTPVVADATGTYNATIAQRYFSGYVMPNNQTFPTGLTFIPAGSVVLDASATDYLYWPGSGTALLVTTTLGTANAAGNALIGTITTNASRVATAFTPNLATLMTGAATCTGTTAVNATAFRFLNTNNRVHGFTAQYFENLSILGGGPATAFVENFGGSTDSFVENMIGIDSGTNSTSSLYYCGYHARCHLGGNIQTTNEQPLFVDFLAIGDTDTPLSSSSGYLVFTAEAATNTGFCCFVANVGGYFIGWGPVVYNFLGTGAITAFDAIDKSHMDMGSNLNMGTYAMFNNANMRVYGSFTGSTVMGISCGAAGLYCNYTSIGRQAQVNNDGYVQDFTQHAGTTPDAVASGGRIVYTDAPQHVLDSVVFTASLVTTAATSDNVAIVGVNANSHCSSPAPTNAAAATNIATTFISAKTTNQITVTHTATANMNYDITCTVN